jgi:hypothetical protein
MVELIPVYGNFQFSTSLAARLDRLGASLLGLLFEPLPSSLQ